MKKLLVITLCTLVTICMPYAQNSENQIQKFRNAFQSEAFRLSGYGHIQYNISEYPERSMAQGRANNSFDIVRALIVASGKLGEFNQYGYNLVYDFGPNARLLELYGEWTPSKATNVRLGQFKTSFTIENPIVLSRIETINPSRAVSALSGGAGDFNQIEQDGKIVNKTGRDVGLHRNSLFQSG